MNLTEAETLAMVEFLEQFQDWLMRKGSVLTQGVPDDAWHWGAPSLVLLFGEWRRERERQER